jgi:hypothetical protein
MFIAKVAYITVADIPDEFHKVSYTSFYHDDSDGAYFEIEILDKREPLFALIDMDILDEEEAKNLVDEEVMYIMIYVPS